VRVDDRVERLAAAQHWALARRQLLALGLTGRQICHRVTTGALRPVHRGVYAYGRPELQERGRFQAAVLAYGPHAHLSHRSAAVFWGLTETRPPLPEVTVAGAAHRRQRGLIVHRTRCLTDDDAAIVDGIPVTSVARTLVDLAGPLTPTRLARAIEQADRTGLLDLRAVVAAAERVSGRRNLARLRRVLATYDDAPPVRSEWERRFVDAVVAASLPRPQVNATVAGLEVDMLWPQWGLIVELDSRSYHADPRSFENDRLRDARLSRAGYRVLRVTYRRFTDDLEAVLDDIRALAALSAFRSADQAG
jgi:hypothetical protein